MARLKGEVPKWTAFSKRKQEQSLEKVGVTVPAWALDGFSDLAAARKVRGLKPDSRQAVIEALVTAMALVAQLESFQSLADHPRVRFGSDTASIAAAVMLDRKRILAAERPLDGYAPDRPRPLTEEEKAGAKRKGMPKATPFLQVDLLDNLIPWLGEGLNLFWRRPEMFARASVASWLAENAAMALRHDAVFERFSSAEDLAAEAGEFLGRGAVLWNRMCCGCGWSVNSPKAWDALAFLGDANAAAADVGEGGEAPDPTPEEIARLMASMEEMIATMGATAIAKLEAIAADPTSAPTLG